MDNFDRENNHVYSAQHYFLGKGKDLLIGWLVGRAGADLALAQALAASCTENGQRNRETEREIASLGDPADERVPQSFKQVEKNLEKNIQDLRHQLTTEHEDLERRHTEIKETFQAELSLLRGELLETQDRLNANLRALQANIEEKFQLVENNHSDLKKVTSETNAIAERTTQLETGMAGVQSSATAHLHDIQQIADIMKSEVSALKIQLGDQQPSIQPADFHDLEDRLRAEIHETRQKLTMLEPRNVQVEEILRVELAGMEARDKAATDLLRHELERLNTKLETVEQRITDAVDTLNNHDADITILKAQGRSVSQLAGQSGAGLSHGTGSEAAIGPSERDGYREEQVQELVRRISFEMERVRAELKENTGRWKISKEALL